MIEERLSRAQESFNAAEVKDEYMKIPDGDYKGFISDVKIDIDRFDIMRIIFEVTLLDSTYAGRKVIPTAPLEGQFQGLSKKYLKILGFDIENLDLRSLPLKFGEMIGKEIVVALSTKINAETGKSFQGTYINKLIEEQKEVQEEARVDNQSSTI